MSAAGLSAMASMVMLVDVAKLCNYRDTTRPSVMESNVVGSWGGSGIKMVFEEIVTENFPNLKKETYPGTGRREGPKQDESKQTHTKTYYNKNGKIRGFKRQQEKSKVNCQGAPTRI